MNMQAKASPVMRAKPQENCPLCHIAGKMLYRGMADRLFSAGGEEWGMAQCQNLQCGLIWMNPMPVVEDLSLAYEDYFTHEGGKESSLRRLCLQLYGLCNAVPAAITGLGTAKARMNSLFLDDVSPGKLLDVGCGDGRFLNEMRVNGWNCSGVEVDAKAVEQARKKYGLDVRLGFLADAAYPDNTFDAITLRHVIEHIPDPIAMLRECKRILRPRGRIVVVTPNTQSLGHEIFTKDWLGLDQPRHLMIFSPNSISWCAREAGISDFQVLTSPANADTVFAVSYSLVKRKHVRLDNTAGPEFGRAFKAILWQHREAWRMAKKPLIGEELVLLAGK
jgi:SAM-dependent methyltransferase